MVAVHSFWRPWCNMLESTLEIFFRTHQFFRQTPLFSITLNDVVPTFYWLPMLQLAESLLILLRSRILQIPRACAQTQYVHMFIHFVIYPPLFSWSNCFLKWSYYKLIYLNFVVKQAFTNYISHSRRPVSDEIHHHKNLARKMGLSSGE